MVAFDRKKDSARLDYQLMIGGPISVLHSREKLAAMVAWLRTEGYEIVEVDASWLATVHMYRDMANAVGYSCHDHLQCLSEGVTERIAAATRRAVGFVLVLTGFDVFANAHIEDARDLLSIIAQPCWSSSVQGGRAMCLVQTDDRALRLGRIGVFPAFVGDWQFPTDPT